jgi:hypothetical protein
LDKRKTNETILSFFVNTYPGYAGRMLCYCRHIRGGHLGWHDHDSNIHRAYYISNIKIGQQKLNQLNHLLLLLLRRNFKQA